jgi:lactobin A/cerein 7B family class IIb bacteriocin
MEYNIMRELNVNEIKEVNGGFLPFIIGVDIGLNLVMLAFAYGSGAYNRP